MATTEVVFHIQRFSLHDGPGIRTTVFLKGCSMRCFWCHNPEGQSPKPELRYYPERCLACGECVVACPNRAHEIHKEVHTFLRDRCTASGKCIDTCYSRALQLEGRTMTVDQVMEEVLLDRPFYETSHGGVTLSGGEPVLSRDFTAEVLGQCRQQGLHTAIETCGEYPWPSLEALVPLIDLVMMDIKHVDPVKHKVATGRSNKRILANARRLALTGKPVVFRTPVVHEVNDSEEEIEQIAAFLHDLKELRKTKGMVDNGTAGITYELLPFHKLAADKYPSLGRAYAAAAIDPPTHEKMIRLAHAAQRHGIEVSYK